MIKSYTDPSQSKKLAEILPIESADMWWVALNWQETEYYVEVKQDGINQPKKAIPCWSLSALLGVLPNNKHITTTLSRGGWKIEPVEYIDKWFCEYEEEDSPSKNFSVSADNPVDACYEVILHLHSNQLL